MERGASLETPQLHEGVCAVRAQAPWCGWGDSGKSVRRGVVHRCKQIMSDVSPAGKYRDLCTADDLTVQSSLELVCAVVEYSPVAGRTENHALIGEREDQAPSIEDCSIVTKEKGLTMQRVLVARDNDLPLRARRAKEEWPDAVLADDLVLFHIDGDPPAEKKEDASNHCDKKAKYSLACDDKGKRPRGPATGPAGENEHVHAETGKQAPTEDEQQVKSPVPRLRKVKRAVGPVSRKENRTRVQRELTISEAEAATIPAADGHGEAMVEASHATNEERDGCPGGGGGSALGVRLHRSEHGRSGVEPRAAHLRCSGTVPSGWECGREGGA